MPIYEYRCESCSGKFEVLTRFAERDISQICPSCESTKTRVLVSSFAVAGGSESSLDFGSEQTSGGGCCGGGCGSCGSSPDSGFPPPSSLGFCRPKGGGPSGPEP